MGFTYSQAQAIICRERHTGFGVIYSQLQTPGESMAFGKLVDFAKLYLLIL